MYFHINLNVIGLWEQAFECLHAMGQVSGNESISMVPIKPNGKVVKAVEPYTEKGSSNFKYGSYKAWKALGGATVPPPLHKCHLLHRLINKIDLAAIAKSRKEARLCCVEPTSINFDTYPSALRYEIIPIIWNCWPKLRPIVERWIKRHHVGTVVFTSTQTADYFRARCQDINVLCITEGIDTTLYHQGQTLNNRAIDLLEYSSIKRNFFHHQIEGVVCANRVNAYWRLDTFLHLTDTLSDSKIVITLPRCDSEPDVAQGVETLTQCYWEVMLSGCVPLGRAPKELTDLIGYNPVIELDREHADEQVRNIVGHIDEYQPLVDRNCEVAMRKATWEIRMKQVMAWLKLLGYQC